MNYLSRLLRRGHALPPRVAAPSFTQIAAKPYVDDAHLKGFVSELHPPMPTFRLSDEQWQAVISYMLLVMELRKPMSLDAGVHLDQRRAISRCLALALAGFALERSSVCREGDWTCVSQGRIGLLARTSSRLDAGIANHRLIWLNAGLSDLSSIANDTSMEACDACYRCYDD